MGTRRTSKHPAAAGEVVEPGHRVHQEQGHKDAGKGQEVAAELAAEVMAPGAQEQQGGHQRQAAHHAG